MPGAAKSTARGAFIAAKYPERSITTAAPKPMKKKIKTTKAPVTIIWINWASKPPLSCMEVWGAASEEAFTELTASCLP